MIICLDVDYRAGRAAAGGLLIKDWEDRRPAKELVRACEEPAEYRPGRFYLRELPPLLALIGSLTDLPETAVIDGYVWLGINREPGLGAYLYRRLEEKIAVVGVAKNPFRDREPALSVYRGESKKPLFVTAAGMEPEKAAAAVGRMAGDFRTPDILKKVDRLCRTAVI